MYFRLKSLLIIACLISNVTYLIAQPSGGPPPPPGEPVPIQGLIVLLIAGAFLGIKKYMGNKKTE
jgi:hypothetical protein